ncbi:beta-mannosidase [Paenibacillus hamazuiensis]|uniref:beta-mannosidase n=1 Tax=Paenibacillus hamazuiensis TaxID=2936508 RepID=UPI00200BCCAC|nr:glycoside hydrolase family 2 protein [Paenibacillus hamazuiensis]
MSETHWNIVHWDFKSTEDREWLQASVPGCVHTDLLKQGIIDNPFYGMNEKRLQWIDKKDWEYRTVFDYPEELQSTERLELVFAGLDTYADVWVNDERVISADNMFREWKADVKSILKPQGNVIRVLFRSPISVDLPKLEQLGYALPAANDQSDVGGLGEQKISVFARKAPYHYGWDWGPRFVTSGIWREVKLIGWSECRITDLYIHQSEVSSSAANLRAVVEVEAAAPWSGSLKIGTGELHWERDIEVSAGIHQVELELQIERPDLWWCRGLGEPNLYTFQAELIREGKSRALKSVQTGLREVRLVTEKDDAGSTFYVELNGVPVFAKGANHIPNDSFLTEITYDRYRHEIETAVASNMNMLRVWGGGIYEQDAFYELCDRHGLLVWQDFMFACSMYPGDEAFLNNVQAEAEYNVKRLRNHPCIALWCGNNEIDTAWAHYDENAGWGWKQQYSGELREKIWADYEAIFHRILPAAVNAYAPGMSYWPSSPLCALTGDSRQHAYATSKDGDTHYWGVWHAVEPFENYNVKVSRFVSEYGFQSFPEYRTVRTYAEESEMALESPVMLAHQKNNRGNQLIKEYMDIYMKEPKDFAGFLYMSQVLQAEAMKMAIEAHRRRKPFCMGSLYWQMNDCWPVASWAGMDYYGNWKAMQYYARRSFQDVAVSLYEKGSGQLELYVLSDQLAEVNGELAFRLMDFDGVILWQQQCAVRIPANSSQQVLAWDRNELLRDRDPASVLFQAELRSQGSVLDKKEHYFESHKNLRLTRPAIQLAVSADSDGTKVVLETDVLAKQVWLSAESDGRFTDNFFDLIPGQPQTVRFQSQNNTAADPEKLVVRSMFDFVS